MQKRPFTLFGPSLTSRSRRSEFDSHWLLDPPSNGYSRSLHCFRVWGNWRRKPYPKSKRAKYGQAVFCTQGLCSTVWRVYGVSCFLLLHLPRWKKNEWRESGTATSPLFFFAKPKVSNIFSLLPHSFTQRLVSDRSVSFLFFAQVSPPFVIADLTRVFPFSACGENGEKGEENLTGMHK